jgi:hypothetical protein
MRPVESPVRVASPGREFTLSVGAFMLHNVSERALKTFV